MSPTPSRTPYHPTQGLLLGLLGVTIFSLSLPMTHVAIAELDPVLVGLGRALVAAIPAAALLLWRRERLPNRAQCIRLAITASGVIVGFPVLSALALRTVPASHGAVVNGLLPLATALYASWFARERPSRAFWGWAVLGSAIVLAYAILTGHGAPSAGDLWMLAAVAVCGLGYAEGARLAKELGDWQVICWALVLSAPVLAAPVAWLALHQSAPAHGQTWFAFGYLALFSQFLGFFAWYAGLARGGIARVGQVQLLQIFLTLGFSALWFGESVAPASWLFAAGVLATVVAGRRAGVSVAPVSARSDTTGPAVQPGT
ncbi:DMT family transporter [Pararobbsia silviterrae]|uniref:DMT family transporter n=1 Tax=Pararobbsia silviterrae TaxID=1792498 RepID=A0A494Y9Q8_9BURK|nr:DMT family transporter [Pararobbsia silviterrae]RKP59452.1 DMT family transporter [Pararobbsia silviterrae]